MLLTEEIRGEAFSGVITLELEGWLLITNNPNPPDVDEEEVDEALRHNRNRIAERRRQRGQAAPRHARRQRTEYQTDGSSSGHSWRDRQQAKWVPKEQKITLLRKDTEKPFRVDKVRGAEYSKTLSQQVAVSGPYCIKNPPSCGIFVSRYRAKGNNQLSQKIQPFNTLYAIVNIQSVTIKVSLTYPTTFSPRDNLARFNPSSTPLTHLLQTNQQWCAPTQQAFNFDSLYYQPGPHQKIKKLAFEKELFMEPEIDLGLNLFTSGPALIQSDEISDSDGPLPGFPFKILNSTGTNLNEEETFLGLDFEEEQPILTTPELPRRSRRIEKKNTGTYTTAIEKAQITQGYSDNSGQAPTPRAKKKEKKPVKLTYLESHDPLFAAQEEAVVSTAGVELGQELVDKICKFIPDQFQSFKDSA